MNRDVKKRATATSRAPQKLKPASKLLEISDPANPPGGIAPRTSGKWQSASREGSDKRRSPYPTRVAAWEPIARLRNHRQPITRNAMGSKNAAKPNTWNSRSALCAPTGPIQLLTPPPSEGCRLTLNAASRGEYEISAAASKTATMMHKNPTSSLSRLFSVGVRKRTNLSSAFWGRLSVAAGAGAVAIPLGGTPERNDDTKPKFPDYKLFQSVCLESTQTSRRWNPRCLSPHPQRPKYNRGSHDHAVHRKRREPAPPHPTHKPRRTTRRIRWLAPPTRGHQYAKLRWDSRSFQSTTSVNRNRSRRPS